MCRPLIIFNFIFIHGEMWGSDFVLLHFCESSVLETPFTANVDAPFQCVPLSWPVSPHLYPCDAVLLVVALSGGVVPATIALFAHECCGVGGLLWFTHIVVMFLSLDF